jgi:hypothetical protein
VAVQRWERFRWVEDHPGWTYDDYDNAKASDIGLAREFLRMMQPMTDKDNDNGR